MSTVIPVIFRSVEPNRRFPSVGLYEPEDVPKKGQQMVIDGKDWWVTRVEWSEETEVQSRRPNVYLTDLHPNVRSWLGL